MSWRRAVAALALPLAGCAAVAPPAPSYEIVGYYPGWKGALDADASQITVLNYAFLDICWDGQHGNAAGGGVFPCAAPDGAVVVDNPPADEMNFARLRALKRANPRLRLMASVGGWTRSNRFSDMATDAPTRAAFIDSTLAFLRRQGFDGIDIDWEYPVSVGLRCARGDNCDRATDKRNFIALGREMRAVLDAAGAADGKRYLFTIAAGADREFLYERGAAWLPELAQSLDWINLMTYDYHGTWELSAGFVAPLYADPLDPTPEKNADASLTLYLAAGIAPAKLVLGVPFYGKGWQGCAPGPKGDGLYQPCAALADVPEAAYEFATLTEKGYLARDDFGRYVRGGLGYTRHWNSAARAPYLYNPADGLFIAYDDEASIREKTRYAAAKGLRGVMFWELNADRHRVLGRVIAEDLPH
jgi:chitinase